MAWQRANSPGSSCLVFILIFTTSCSSVTPVRDAGVESDVEIEYDVASYGELFIDETDNPQLLDAVFSSFPCSQLGWSHTSGEM